MKITKRQLKRIIKEERNRLVREGFGEQIETGSPLIEFAQAYSGLGWAIQEQVNTLVSYFNTAGPQSEEFRTAIYDQNSNAIIQAIQRLGPTLRNLEGGEDVWDALLAAQDVITQYWDEPGAEEGAGALEPEGPQY